MKDGELLASVAERIRQERKMESVYGHNFNLLRILNLEDHEVSTCAILRELLDPEGSHGQGKRFLELFCEMVLKAPLTAQETCQHISVYKEYVLPESKRRIDLVIRTSQRFIPIEVKIFAADQPKQCQDYYDYASSLDPDARIYYLTIFGTMPGTDSIGGMPQDKITTISFQTDIMEWIELCLGEKGLQKNIPVQLLIMNLRELIRGWGNMMDEKLSELVEEIKASKENLMAAKRISDAWREIRETYFMVIFENIKKHLESDMQGFHIEELSEAEKTACEDHDFENQKSREKYRSHGAGEKNYIGIYYRVKDSKVKTVSGREYQLYVGIEAMSNIYAQYIFCETSKQNTEFKTWGDLKSLDPDLLGKITEGSDWVHLPFSDSKDKVQVKGMEEFKDERMYLLNENSNEFKCGLNMALNELKEFVNHAYDKIHG